MISAKQAIQSAIRFLGEIFDDDGNPSIRVEELEQGREDSAWYVTLSYYPASDTRPGLSESMKAILAPERVYKSFEINSSTGEVRSMKIRELQ